MLIYLFLWFSFGGSQLRVVLLPRGHVAMCGDIFFLPQLQGGATDETLVRLLTPYSEQDSLQQQQNYPSQNVNSSEVEKPCFTSIFLCPYISYMLLIGS